MLSPIQPFDTVLGEQSTETKPRHSFNLGDL